MKSALGMLLVFVLAFVMGRWSPQADLRQKQREIERLQKEVKRQDLGGIGQILQFEPEEEQRGRRHRRRSREREEDGVVLLSPPERDAGAGTNAVVVAAGVEEVAEDGEDGERRGRRRGSGEERSMEEEIEAAFALWATRSEVARATFLSNLGATDEEAGHFDASLELMNRELEVVFASWADHVQEGGHVRSSDGARLFQEVSRTVVEAYDRLDQHLPPDWEREGGDRFQLFDFIDPNVGRPLIGVEGLLRDSGREEFRF